MSKAFVLRTADHPPAEVREYLGRPPTISTESETLYWAMIASLAELAKPRMLLTWFLIKDIVDARIEIQRWRLFKAELINNAGRSDNAGAGAAINDPAVDAVFEKMREIIKQEGGAGYWVPDYIAKAWEENQKVMDATEKAPPSHRDLALLLHAWIEPVRQVDHLQEAAENRYYIATLELERHLSSFAHPRLEAVIEGEVIETAPPRERGRPRGKAVLSSVRRQRRKRRKAA
jgi:hypothetical protein